MGKICENCDWKDGDFCPHMLDCKNYSEFTPKQKTGYWIDDEFGSKCSCCGIHTHLDKFDRPMKFKNCSMCGAKMIEPQESEAADAKKEQENREK